MPQRKKLSPEERIQHRRESQRKYRAKIKLLKDEWKHYEKLALDLYPTKPKRTFTQEQREFLKQLFNMPLSKEKIKPKNNTAINAKRQIGIALTQIKRNKIGSIDFDLSNFTDEDKKYFFENLPKVIYQLLMKLNLNEHWVVYYYYGNSWKMRIIDTFTSNYLREQIQEELENNLSWIEYKENHNSGDSFFPVSIKELTQLRFINEDEVGLRGRANNNKLNAKDFKRKEDYSIYINLIKSKVKQDIINKFLKVHLKTHNEGAFWKWLNKYNEINLEEFGIFSEINKRTVRIMERDNCFIYACSKWGISNEILNDMRYSIKKRLFSIHDITIINQKLNLSFNIKVYKDNIKTKTIKIGTQDENTIKLILLNNHYMINKKVYVSPYYIRNREEIINKVHKMKSSEMLKINRKELYPDGRFKKYKKSKKPFKITTIIKTLFEVNGFEPIKLNQIYDNMGCFEEIIEDNSLDYDPKLCTRRII